ncbi:hypothetical protein PRIPAC_71623 [Pristionchus pacificus]|uniref:Uncharacterized protein n=1 Tax=Pristionchus pacificus TaxID=54126 RepID=A0A2A6CSX3_PRIPA|nr:hypothetical protein PRIPAC_71623 [Pristionchus pacificus]|eukprot:PDM81295.1 hypothetical protein PRIPAC_36298 [Pristionchus pacificus]
MAPPPPPPDIPFISNTRSSLFAAHYELLPTLHSTVKKAVSNIQSIRSWLIHKPCYSHLQSKRALLGTALDHLVSSIHAYSKAVAYIRDQISSMTDSDHKIQEESFLHKVMWEEDLYDDLPYDEDILIDTVSFHSHSIDQVLARDLRWLESDIRMFDPSYRWPNRINRISDPSCHTSTSSLSCSVHPSGCPAIPPAPPLHDFTVIQFEPSIPLITETIAASGSVADNSNDSILTPPDSDPVWQTVAIIPSPSSNPIKISTTVPVKDPSIVSVLSSNNHIIPNHHIDSAYPIHSLVPIPIHGTAPKKKQHHHSTTPNLQYPFHFLPWREGSRSLSITHSTIHSIDSFVDSIAATKHPPLPSYSTPHSILYLDYSDPCSTVYKKTSYLFDQPWPDDLSHSFNCSYIVPPIIL